MKYIFRRFWPVFWVSVVVTIGIALALSSPVFSTTSSTATSADYILTFESTWSSTTHPIDFPDNAHYSRLVGATHPATTHLWQVGEFASLGIRAMAETGSPSPLDLEVAQLVEAGGACEFLLDDQPIGSPGTTAIRFTATQVCPAISIVTMIAPSPDWFVGVSGVNLYDNNEWIDRLVIPLLPYDAGTDDGTTYSAENRPALVPQPISKIQTPAFVYNGEVKPLGTFTVTKM